MTVTNTGWEAALCTVPQEPALLLLLLLLLALLLHDVFDEELSGLVRAPVTHSVNSLFF